jgi:hypothetical protein
MIICDKVREGETAMPLPEPNKALIKSYIEQFDNDNPVEKTIADVFSRHNKNRFDDIFIKVCVLNTTYSTNIYDAYGMSKHINKENIYTLLHDKNLDAVNQIKSGHDIKTGHNTKDINYYSFATKYCNWHHQNIYPIYDKFVAEVLYRYNKVFHFYERFTKESLRNIDNLEKIILCFKKTFYLDEFTFKDLDKFFWYYGKNRMKDDLNEKAV